MARSLTAKVLALALQCVAITGFELESRITNLRLDPLRDNRTGLFSFFIVRSCFLNMLKI